MIAKKVYLWGVSLTLMLGLGACGGDRSAAYKKHIAKEAPTQEQNLSQTPKKKDTPKNPPRAILKMGNIESHVRRDNEGGVFVYTLFPYESNQFIIKGDERFMPDPFIFRADKSKVKEGDIVSFDWNVSMRLEDVDEGPSEDCLDINRSDDRLVLYLCERAEDDGNMTIVLTVTDDRGLKDSATQVVKFK